MPLFLMRFVSLRYLLLAAVIGLSALIFSLRSCLRKAAPTVGSLHSVNIRPELPDNAQLEVNFSPSRILSVEAKIKDQPPVSEDRYVPQDGSATVTLLNDGKLDFDVKNKGFSFRPGLGVQLTDKLRLAADVQVFYWNRFEVYLGGAFPEPVGHIGLGYRLDQIKLANTSLAVVYTSRRSVGAEIRVRF